MDYDHAGKRPVALWNGQESPTLQLARLDVARVHHLPGATRDGSGGGRAAEVGRVFFRLPDRERGVGPWRSWERV